MKQVGIACVLLAVLLYACSGTPSTKATLTGEWVPQSAELGGKEFPVSAFNGASLNLTADSYEFGGDKGAYKVMEGETPAQMDIHGVEGPNAGKDIPAIYKLDGDQLVICYQLAAGDRPGEFKTTPGTQEFLVHFKRKQ